MLLRSLTRGISGGGDGYRTRMVRGKDHTKMDYPAHLASLRFTFNLEVRSGGDVDVL